MALGVGVLFALDVATLGFLTVHFFGGELSMGVVVFAFWRLVDRWGGDLLRLLFSCCGVFFFHLNFLNAKANN
jgi:hypothetical protein